jgi:molybdopterin-guanine dinucleotide biosynthesis protein A
MTFSALLLAGGESRRMGRDKATLEFDGEPLWERQLTVLRALRPEKLFISAREKPVWLPHDAELLIDDPPSRGPLGGLTKGLEIMRTTHLLVLAVDMPFITAGELSGLVARATADGGIVPLIGDHTEPLAAIYPSRAVVEFQAALVGSDFSLQTVVRKLEAAGQINLWQVPETQVKLYRSVNEPCDLKL